MPVKVKKRFWSKTWVRNTRAFRYVFRLAKTGLTWGIEVRFITICGRANSVTFQVRAGRYSAQIARSKQDARDEVNDWPASQWKSAKWRNRAFWR